MKLVAALLKKKLILAAVSAMVVGSVAYAFAATLNLSSGTLSAGDTPVDACDTGTIALSYTSQWDTVSHKFLVNTIAFGGVPAPCRDLAAQIQFTNAAGTAEVGQMVTTKLPNAISGSATLDNVAPIQYTGSAGHATPGFATANIISSAVFHVNVSVG